MQCVLDYKSSLMTCHHINQANSIARPAKIDKKYSSAYSTQIALIPHKF